MVAATASKPAEKPTEMEVEKSPAEKEEEKRNLIVQDVKGQIKEIEKAVFAKEPRIISKVIIWPWSVHFIIGNSGFETVASYKTRSNWWNTGESYPTTQYWKKGNLAQFLGMQRYR